MTVTHIRYASPAKPPIPVDIKRTYELCLDDNGYFIVAGKDNKKYYMTVDFAKALFAPIDTTWDAVLSQGGNSPVVITTGVKKPTSKKKKGKKTGGKAVL